MTGTEPLNSLNVDTYVATRTSTGWTTALVGLKGSEALGASLTIGNQEFTEFMDYYSNGGFAGMPQPGHNLPYIWGPDGSFRGRWPLTQSLIPDAEETIGAYQSSPDFSHLAFTSSNVAFAPNGLVEPPGSAYDYDTETGSTSLISLLPGGENLDIPVPPGAEGLNQYITFASSRLPHDGYLEWEQAKVNPSVSTDGSHIVMGVSDGKWPLFSSEPEPSKYLYMRVNDAISYEIGVDESGEDHPVDYVGMTADGKKVFFTTDAQLTGEDTDHSVDLYMWNEANGGEITLISKGDSGTGNEEECGAKWTEKCNAMPVDGAYETDNAIAEESGEIYFYSPEVLDGTKRNSGGTEPLPLPQRRGHVRRFLLQTRGLLPGGNCSNGPVGRIQVSPDGAHVALLTKDQLTPYNNNNSRRCTRTTRPLKGSTAFPVCRTANPDGQRQRQPPGTLHDQRRTDILLHAGCTHSEGHQRSRRRLRVRQRAAAADYDRDQLRDHPDFELPHPSVGFEGVSANGLDAYFSTYETLVGQDQNGEYLKFYDARTGGGFPYVPPAAPCEAADECHGEGSCPTESAGHRQRRRTRQGVERSRAAKSKKKTTKKKATRKKSGRRPAPERAARRPGARR